MSFSYRQKYIYEQSLESLKHALSEYNEEVGIIKQTLRESFALMNSEDNIQEMDIQKILSILHERESINNNDVFLKSTIIDSLQQLQLALDSKSISLKVFFETINSFLAKNSIFKDEINKDEYDCIKKIVEKNNHYLNGGFFQLFSYFRMDPENDYITVRNLLTTYISRIISKKRLQINKSKSEAEALRNIRVDYQTNLSAMYTQIAQCNDEIRECNEKLTEWYEGRRKQTEAEVELYRKNKGISADIPSITVLRRKEREETEIQYQIREQAELKKKTVSSFLEELKFMHQCQDFDGLAAKKKSVFNMFQRFIPYVHSLKDIAQFIDLLDDIDQGHQRYGFIRKTQGPFATEHSYGNTNTWVAIILLIQNKIKELTKESLEVDDETLTKLDRIMNCYHASIFQPHFNTRDQANLQDFAYGLYGVNNSFLQFFGWKPGKKQRNQLFERIIHLLNNNPTQEAIQKIQSILQLSDMMNSKVSNRGGLHAPRYPEMNAHNDIMCQICEDMIAYQGNDPVDKNKLEINIKNHYDQLIHLQYQLPPLKCFVSQAYQSSLEM